MDLELPTRRKTTDTSFNTSPDVVRAWVDELPLINTEKSWSLLDDALKQINSLSLSTRNRLETLELLATSVICVAETMKKVFLAKPIPLRDHNLLLASQTVELCNQMASGYRILADDLGHDDSQTSPLTVAIHRSLRYLSEILLTNYQVYIQYPEGLWKTINSLYALAEQHDITTQPITDTTLSTPARSTISTVYKQILLMSLACPYRLRQKEIHFVYNALMDWADITRLYYKDGEQAPGFFVISLNADNGRRIVTTGKTQAEASSSENPTDTSRLESWTMANISAGGYSLLWDSDDSSNAQVGEVVAIIEQNTLCENEWHLGVVRWMKCTSSYGLELGIQMLSPSAQAVWAYMNESGIHTGRKMQGILLPEIKMLRQQASLLLPTLPFRAGCVATLETAGALENIKLTRQLENTGSFAQYHFSNSIND